MGKMPDWCNGKALGLGCGKIYGTIRFVYSCFAKIWRKWIFIIFINGSLPHRHRPVHIEISALQIAVCYNQSLLLTQWGAFCSPLSNFHLIWLIKEKQRLTTTVKQRRKANVFTHVICHFSTPITYQEFISQMVPAYSFATVKALIFGGYLGLWILSEGTWGGAGWQNILKFLYIQKEQYHQKIWSLLTPMASHSAWTIC